MAKVTTALIDPKSRVYLCTLEVEEKDIDPAIHLAAFGKDDPVRVAVLDPARRVFTGMAEVPAGELDASMHLLHLGECDNTPGAYRWEPAEGMPLGGHFVPLETAKRAIGGGPSLEIAAAFDYLQRWSQDPAALPELTLKWLDAILSTIDFGSYRSVPLVIQYAAKRGVSMGDT